MTAIPIADNDPDIRDLVTFKSERELVGPVEAVLTRMRA
jgi:hypothetical protein